MNSDTCPKTAQEIYFILIMGTWSKEQYDSHRRSGVMSSSKPVRSGADERFLKKAKELIYKGNTTYDRLLRHCGLSEGSTQKDIVFCFPNIFEAQKKYEELHKITTEAIAKLWREKNDELLRVYK